MVSKVLSGVLFIALVITGFWGYREHQQKQALLLKAENQYQRAFHDLSSHMDLLQDELGKSLAINSARQLSPCLSNVWRLAYSAQADVGQLPLTLMPFNRTQEFLQDLGNFTYHIAIRDTQKQPLNEQERKTLHQLYKESNDVEQNLRKLQTAVIEKNLRWMDAEIALSEQNKKTDNQIVDGFRMIDKRVSQYPELQSPTVTDLKSRNRPNIQNVSGNNVTPEQAAKQVANFFGMSDTKPIQVMPNGQGTSYPSYSVTVDKSKGGKIFLGQTVKGGHVVWMVDQREVGEARLDLVQAQEKAEAWLANHGFKNLTLTKTNQFDNVGIYTFAYQQGNVTVYPDTITVKVALDNGDVVGFNDQDWLFHHRQRMDVTPKLTAEQARKFVSPTMRVAERRLAIVQNDLGKEKLVWEFLGTLDNNTYKVFIDANTGEEQGVEKLKTVS
ncbi:germination protein YpeB [Collibacillus ludicampi]|uniref:Germination protein YpeB n=1 Tax=Collibacillus ludicampi TaxID=2771369 RepID=A0AAV4LK76_9BACL|nr:germination protein YpeB [Collibacillus ludicampi]GIM48218.1 germination protein YpeB [Collibacillus ludicampi]